jgi:hypothetical protein
MNNRNDTPQNRQAKAETCHAVIREFFDVMDKHRLEPNDAMTAMTNFVLMLMPALEAGGDVAQTKEECARRAVEWFAYVGACAAKGEDLDIGITGHPH